MMWRFVDCLHRGEPLDQDVYDAAAWSSIGPLSEKSIATRSQSVDVPDFTRGRWKSIKPLGIVGYAGNAATGQPNRPRLRRNCLAAVAVTLRHDPYQLAAC